MKAHALAVVATLMAACVDVAATPPSVPFHVEISGQGSVSVSDGQRLAVPQTTCESAENPCDFRRAQEETLLVATPAPGWKFDHFESARGETNTLERLPPGDPPNKRDIDNRNTTILLRVLVVFVPDPLHPAPDPVPPTEPAPDAGDDSGGGTTGPCPSSAWFKDAKGTCYLKLGGPWQPSTDANDSPPTKVTLAGASQSQVSVKYTGGDGNMCGCNAQRMVIPLGRSFDCAKSALELTYAFTGMPSFTNSPSVEVRFAKNGASTSAGFYNGQGFKGSSYAGHSNCAWQWSNTFPATPQLRPGLNTIDLVTLKPATSGMCTGSFDTIDIHVQGYACYDREVGTITVSNVRIFEP